MIAPSTPSVHLILGGCGFIGMAVAMQLLREGKQVVLADRTTPETLPPGMSFIPFNLENADWGALIDGVNVIHHYAWSSIPATADANPAADLAQNAIPTLSLLDAMKRQGTQAPRLVFTSSGGTVYGRLRRVPVPEDHPLQPVTAYGAGKASVEMYMSQHRLLHGLDCRIARLSNPFGAGQNVARGQGAASVFLHKALRGEVIEIWGDGEVMRDYVHISDVAVGLVALATCELPEHTHIFNIGSGKGTSLNGIVTEIEHHLGHSISVRRTPSRPFDVPISILDISLARDLLGWVPRLNFADGMARTIDELGKI